MSHVASDIDEPFRLVGSSASDRFTTRERESSVGENSLSSFAVEAKPAHSSFGVQMSSRDVPLDIQQMSRETPDDRDTQDGDMSSLRYFRTDSALLMETVGQEDAPKDDATGDNEDREAPQRIVDVQERKSLKKKSRIYYLDWLRVMAIYLVVFYHCIQALDWVKLWKGVEEQHVIAYKSASLQVGMPIFFHISGRAQALTKLERIRKTFISRCQRLLIPFFIAYILLIPFWQYVQVRDRRDGKFADQPQFFLTWLFWFCQPGHYWFEVGWLWFLPALFVCGVFNAPLFLFAERRDAKYGIMLALCWIGVTVLLCYFKVPFMVMFFSAFGPLALCILSIAVPFPPRGEQSWSAMRWLAVQGSTFIQILCMFGMVCSFSYEELGGLKMVPAFLLFFGFYNHGYFVQRWAVGRADADSEQERTPGDREWKRKLKLGTGIWQIMTVCMMVLSVAIGAPVGAWEEELFPIYSASFRGSPFFAVAHLAGTWAMIGLVVAWFQAFANREIHPTIYKHATKSVIVVYIFHWVFIAPFAYWICRDLNMMKGGWKLIDPLLTLCVACLGPFALYNLLLRYPRAGALFGL